MLRCLDTLRLFYSGDAGGSFEYDQNWHIKYWQQIKRYSQLKVTTAERQDMLVKARRITGEGWMVELAVAVAINQQKCSYREWVNLSF